MSDFTVVIPAYRAAGTLRRAVESALRQEVPAAEVIVVDDCSPDDQHDVVRDLPITYVRRAANGGEAAAKNSGVQAATTTWVVTLDSDDAWLPQRLSAISALHASDPDADIITTDAFVQVDGQRVRQYYGGSRGVTWVPQDQSQAILQANFIFSHAAVRRSRWLEVGGMDESRRDVAADWPLWVRLILTGSRAALADEPLADYTVRAGSISDSRRVLLATRAAALLAAATSPGCSPTDRLRAESQLATVNDDLRMLDAMSGLWNREPDRRALAAVVRSGHGRRTRAAAAVGTLVPELGRRILKRDPLEWDRE